MSKIVICIEAGAPAEPKKAPKQAPKQTLEQEVREMIDLIESGYESSIEWRALKGLYMSLAKKKRTPRIDNLIKMMKPVLSKYGHHIE